MDEQAIRASERARIVQELGDIPYWSNGVGDGFDLGFGAEPDLSITPTRSMVIQTIANRSQADWLDELAEKHPDTCPRA